MFLLSVHGTQAQDQSDVQAPTGDFAATLELVESSQIQFEADRALPQGGRIVDMTTRPNWVEVRGKNAKGDLAFFGRAGNIAYNPDGGRISAITD